MSDTAPTAVPPSEHAESVRDEKLSGTTETLAEVGGPGEVEVAAAEPPAVPKYKIVMTMLALSTAVFLAALDQTIVTTALPTIARDLKASQADYAWVGSTYLLAGAAAMPSIGKISDIFGRKPALLFANFLFFIGSLVCALSINIGMLQAGRVIQGIGGGGLMTLVNICISDMFSMRDRGMYMGIIGLVFAVASCIGPIVGGAFTEFVTWRWCFYLNLPFDGVAFILLVTFLDIENPRTPLVAGLKAIDWLGSLLIVTGAVTLLIGLEFGGIVHPWKSATTICLIIFGVVIMALFVFVEARVAKYPIMPIRLLRNRSNVAALATNVAHGFDFIAAAYFLPLYFQAVLGASPLLSGVYLLPFAFTLSMLATGTGIFIKKTGKFLPPIQFGLALMVLGFGLFISLPSYPSWAKVVIYQLILGVGVGCLFQSPLIALHTQVNPQDIATVTALFGFSRNFSTALSVVIGSAIFQNQVAVHANKTYPRLPQDIIDGLSGGSVGENTGIAQSLPGSQRIQVLNVYTQSLQVMWIFYTVVVFLGFLCTFGIATKKLDTTHVGTKRGLEAEEKHRLAQKAERQAKKEEKSQA